MLSILKGHILAQVVFDLEWVSSSTAAIPQPAGSAGEAASAGAEDEVMLPAEAPIKALSVNAGIAARALSSEGIIIVPTDTLYGASCTDRALTAE